jgi:hypothetical protein
MHDCHRHDGIFRNKEKCAFVYWILSGAYSLQEKYDRLIMIKIQTLRVPYSVTSLGEDHAKHEIGLNYITDNYGVYSEDTSNFTTTVCNCIFVIIIVQLGTHYEDGSRFTNNIFLTHLLFARRRATQIVSRFFPVTFQ